MVGQTAKDDVLGGEDRENRERRRKPVPKYVQEEKTNKYARRGEERRGESNKGKTKKRRGNPTVASTVRERRGENGDRGVCQ